MFNKYRLSVLMAGAAIFMTAAPSAFAMDGISMPRAGLKMEIGAEQTAGAQKFIDGMAQRAIGFLDADDLSEEQRKEEFKKLLRDSFDMQTLGRFSLGTNWKTATAEQKAEYQKLFEKMIVEVYSRRFNDYNGQKLEVRGGESKSDTDTLVTSYIIPDSGPEVRVEWRVRYKDGRYKIVDVIVEGVSMALTQRSDFASVIQRGGGQVEVLLAHLRQ